VLPYVRPDELLVTTGYALRENPDQLGALVRELHRRGVAALGVKLGRYLDEMPRSAVEAADELGFPLVALPASTSRRSTPRSAMPGPTIAAVDRGVSVA
jgi:purine catabolism regulator